MKNAGYFYRRKMRNVFKSVRLSACLVIIMTHVSLLLSQYSVAQEVTPPSSLLTPRITDVFKQMPDSLMPYLTANNRLDFIDFMDSNMKAEVSNRTGGTSEMTALTDDSLSIRMSESLRVDMLLFNLDEPVDTIRQVLAFVETFMADSLHGENTCRFYTADWKRLPMDIPLNSTQQKRLSSLGLQNILKWEEDILNNH